MAENMSIVLQIQMNAKKESTDAFHTQMTEFVQIHWVLMRVLAGEGLLEMELFPVKLWAIKLEPGVEVSFHFCKGMQL